MSFLDNVILPSSTSNSPTPIASSKGSFLNSVVMPPEGYVAPMPKPPVSNGINIPDTGNSYTTYAPSTMKTLADLQVNPLSLQKSNNPLEIVKNTVSDYVGGIGESIKNLWDESGNFIKQDTLAGKVGSGASLLAKGANVFLSPITSLFSAANDVPILGTVSKLISLPFELAGDAGRDAAYPIVNALPIPKASKEKLVDGVGEMISLAGQIAIGGGIDKGGKMLEVKTMDLVNKYGPEDARTIVDVAKRMATEKAQTVTSQPTTPIVANKVKGGFLDNVVKPEETSPIKSPEQTPVIETKTTATEGNLIDVRTAKSASDINQRFIDQGLKNIPEEQLAKYEPNSYKTDAQRVKDLMDTNMEKARDMATGKIPLSPDIKFPQILFNAMEEFGLKNGDVELLKKLATSETSTKLSQAGGELGSHGFNDNPNSPVEAIREITKVREEAAKKIAKEKDITKVKKNTIKEIKSEVSKVKSKQTWSEFVKSVQC